MDGGAVPTELAIALFVLFCQFIDQNTLFLVHQTVPDHNAVQLQEGALGGSIQIDQFLRRYTVFQFVPTVLRRAPRCIERGTRDT